MKKVTAAAVSASAIVAAATGGMLFMSASSAAPNGDVKICHATGSAKNPYQVNSVDPSSVDNQGGAYLNGHGDHDGPLFDPMGGPGQPTWGDIIPPIESPTDPENNFDGLNWTTAGQAIYENGCKPVEPVDEEITICHALDSITSPYESATVLRSSVDKNGAKYLDGHADHSGPVFDPEGGVEQPQWGDIIPPITSLTEADNDYDGLNWDAAGQAIYDNGCAVPTPTPPPTTPPPPSGGGGGTATTVTVTTPTPTPSPSLTPVVVAPAAPIVTPPSEAVVEPATAPRPERVVPASVPAGGGAAATR